MPLSRSTRIAILLVIDVAFFFIELTVGYAVGSLALVADSFHMLNDVMSLVVALYAIRLTNNSVASAKYSYGWHRAEILAALINGVFLLALCFSILMEAIERFFSVPEVANPKLVVIVGSLGLASNLLGLFLFHEHGHSHSHSHPSTPDDDGSDADSVISPLLPHQQPASVPAPVSHRRTSTSRPSKERRRSDSLTSLYGHPVQTRASLVQVAEELRASPDSPGPHQQSPQSPSKKLAHTRRRSSSSAVARLSQSAPSPGEGGTLEQVLRRASGEVSDSRWENERRAEEGRAGPRQDLAGSDDETDAEDRPLIGHPAPNGQAPAFHNHGHSHDESPSLGGAGGHSHSHAGGGHGNMNMRALLLHVLGDALGNVGVIASGLIIWLTTWQYKYYSDPFISLIITVIIFTSTLPLVKSASFILLQGVPTSVSLDAVRESIRAIPGVISVHELHIWQLSESKIVASVHVLVKKSKISLVANGEDDFTSSGHKHEHDHEFTPSRSSRGPPTTTRDAGGLVVVREESESEEFLYMSVAAQIRRALHYHGIHSSTIQPEYCVDGSEDDADSVQSACLLPCPADVDCDPSNACCPPLPNPQPIDRP